ncbi:hypothetical protein DFH28DRAFT_1069695 [Melampsora americana]|nr:hypothetical protein DFH28DRAFT_1069695 [Melampsora americana]
MNDIEAEKEKEGWSDDDPEYLKRKKSLIEDYVINHCCKYYYQIEHILGTRDKATRLDGATSAAPNPAGASLDCLRVSSKRLRPSPVAGRFEPNIRDDKHHSQASNEEFHRQQGESQIVEDDFDEQFLGALDDKFEDDGKYLTQHLI